MKQIIENIIPNRKAALIAAGAAVLLLCVFVAIPFTAAAFGKGFQPAETQPSVVAEQPLPAGDGNSLALAEALADQKVLELELEQKDAAILALEEENQILREALGLVEEENTELLQRLTEAEEAAVREQERFDLMVSKYSKKYVAVVKVVKDCYLWIEDDGRRYEVYLTEEEYAQIQKDDVLTSCDGLDIPSTGKYQIIVVNKYIAQLEGID